MKRIVLAHPCYGSLDAEVNKALRVAMMSAARHAEWIGDVSTVRVGWVGARNLAVKSALQDAPECDGIVWVDDDVLLPSTAITRLVGYDKDFVTGIVFQKADGFNPLVARWNGNGFAWWKQYPENVLAPADGCGFGCCYTSTTMLKAIEKLPDFKKDGWFNQFRSGHFGPQSDECSDTDMSEDFSFCMRAKLAGYQLYADTGLLCSHMIGPKYSTRETFAKFLEEKERDEMELKDKQLATLRILDASAA